MRFGAPTTNERRLLLHGVLARMKYIRLPKNALRICRMALLVLPALCGCAGAAPRQTPSPASEAPGKVLMYEATSPSGAKVHVLGSIHVGDSSFYPVDPIIEQAFSSADALVVEADISKVDPLAVMRLVVRYAALPQGTTLADKIGAEAFASLENFMSRHGVPIANVTGFAPWWVAMNVLTLQLTDQGLTNDSGIDKHFLDRAHAASKSVFELESVESQISMLAGLPSDIQEMMLLDALVGGMQNGNNVRLILEAWKNGDANAVEQAIFEELAKKPEWMPLKEALITKRNIDMAEKITAMAKPDKALFVVIGAGHVVGDQGVPALLLAKGYAVRQMDKAPAAQGEEI
jgi:uncharacterized protein YbaP (TraB family)